MEEFLHGEWSDSEGEVSGMPEDGSLGGEMGHIHKYSGVEVDVGEGTDVVA